MAHLEANNNLSPTQSGYRKHRIIKYQLALLAREIKNAFQLKKKTVAVFYYLSKAFDKVWREGLLLKSVCQDGCRSGSVAFSAIGQLE